MQEEVNPLLTEKLKEKGNCKRTKIILTILLALIIGGTGYFYHHKYNSEVVVEAISRGDKIIGDVSTNYIMTELLEIPGEKEEQIFSRKGDRVLHRRLKGLSVYGKQTKPVAYFYEKEDFEKVSIDGKNEIVDRTSLRVEIIDKRTNFVDFAIKNVPSKKGYILFEVHIANVEREQKENPSIGDRWLEHYYE